MRVSPALLELSRTAPEFVMRLFELEVPEIGDGLLEIKACARDPGLRAKIGVKSNDPRIDPIGACVGQKGVRIQAVMEEINGERVDMIEWSEDAIKLISTALQPASISAVIIVNAQEHMDDKGRKIKKRAAVFVEEAQRPMAIGKKGQNIRLAFSSDDVCTAGAMTVRVEYIITNRTNEIQIT
jgi:N utilization substance protein A